MLKVLEVLFILLLIIFAYSQVLAPLVQRRKMFPLFGRRAKLEAEIADVNTALDERDLEKESADLKTELLARDLTEKK